MNVVGDAVIRVEDLVLLRKCELAESRDARLDAEDLAILGGKTIDELRVFRPRPDEAHLALEDIPELRKLIKLRLRQETAHPRKASIAFHSERRAARRVHQLAELQHVEHATAMADTAANVDHGAPAIEPDR